MIYLNKKKKKYLNKFDIVIASEVIEHVNERKVFLSDVSKLCRSCGLVVFTTINSSFLGVLLAKFFAENILKVVPQNTHDPNKFISPQRLSSEAEEHNIILDNFVSIYSNLHGKSMIKFMFWFLSIQSNDSMNSLSINVTLF